MDLPKEKCVTVYNGQIVSPSGFKKGGFSGYIARKAASSTAFSISAPTSDESEIQAFRTCSGKITGILSWMTAMPGPAPRVKMTNTGKASSCSPQTSHINWPARAV